MLESELQQAHAHPPRKLRHSRVVRPDKIRPRSLVHRDDDATAAEHTMQEPETLETVSLIRGGALPFTGSGAPSSAKPVERRPENLHNC